MRKVIFAQVSNPAQVHVGLAIQAQQRLGRHPTELDADLLHTLWTTTQRQYATRFSFNAIAVYRNILYHIIQC